MLARRLLMSRRRATAAGDGDGWRTPNLYLVNGAVQAFSRNGAGFATLSTVAGSGTTGARFSGYVAPDEVAYYSGGGPRRSSQPLSPPLPAPALASLALDATTTTRIFPLRDCVLVGVADAGATSPIHTLEKRAWGSGVLLESVAIAGSGFFSTTLSTSGQVANGGQSILAFRPGTVRHGRHIVAQAGAVGRKLQGFFDLGADPGASDVPPFGVFGPAGSPPPETWGTVIDAVREGFAPGPQHRHLTFSGNTTSPGHGRLPGRTFFAAAYRIVEVHWDGSASDPVHVGSGGAYRDAYLAVQGAYGRALMEFGPDGVPRVRRFLSRTRFFWPPGLYTVRDDGRVYTDAETVIDGVFSPRVHSVSVPPEDGDWIAEAGGAEDGGVDGVKAGRGRAFFRASLPGGIGSGLFRAPLDGEGGVERLLPSGGTVSGAFFYQREGVLSVNASSGHYQSEDFGDTWTHAASGTLPVENAIPI